MNPEDLRAAVLERLDRGLLDSIRAELQTNVLAALATSEPAAIVVPPRPPPNIVLVHDLIREYLASVGYLHTLSCLNLESGGLSLDGTARRLQRDTELPRTMMAAELGIADTSATRAVPLLYTLVVSAKEEHAR